MFKCGEHGKENDIQPPKNGVLIAPTTWMSRKDRRVGEISVMERNSKIPLIHSGLKGQVHPNRKQKLHGMGMRSYYLMLTV